MEDERETTSLRQRLKKSSITIPCCFHSSDDKSRSPSTWMRSRVHDLPDIRRKHHRIGRYRRVSADFSYDPMSYALNFDDGDSAKEDEARVRDFSGHLARSQPMPAARSIAPVVDNAGNVAPPPRTVAREILVEIC